MVEECFHCIPFPTFWISNHVSIFKNKKQLQLKEKNHNLQWKLFFSLYQGRKIHFQNGDEADEMTPRFTQPHCRWEVHLQLNSFAFSLSGGERWESVHLFNKDSLSDYHEPASLGSKDRTLNKRASSQHLRRLQGSHKGDWDLSLTGHPSQCSMESVMWPVPTYLSNFISPSLYINEKSKVAVNACHWGACLQLLLGQACPGEGHPDPRILKGEIRGPNLCLVKLGYV